MRSIKYRIRNFFGFSRAQTNGFVGLLLLVSIVLFSEPLYQWWASPQSKDFSKERLKLDSLTAHWELKREENNQVTREEEMSISFFQFNPNSTSETELKALGFSNGLAKRLLNYRAKGGKFRIKSDLKKLYGMDSAFYQSLVQYIDLPEKIIYPEGKLLTERKKFVPFNINEADTTQLKSIYGVGPVLSRRIIKYRESLGGFISINQLREVYGLDSVVISNLKAASFLADGFTPRKVNINEADEKMLSTHPYFSVKTAKAITTYRFQHGKFKTVDDLKKIQIVNIKTIDKIYPYLTVE